MWSDQLDEVVPRQRVAADEHEAARPEGDALVDRVAPLGRGQLVVGRGRAVVAVPAGAAAAVRHVQVDLAHAAERLAAQRRAALEPVEHAEVGRLVDVHPERELRDPQARGLRRAQRVLEQAGAAHRRRGEQLRQGLRAGVPGPPAGADEVVAAVGRRAQDQVGAPGLELRERLLQVLRRERGAVAVDDDDGSGSVRERRGEHPGQPLAEPVSALRHALPAPVASRQRVVRGALRGRRLGQHQPRVRSRAPRRPASRGAGARRPPGRRRRRAPSPDAS